MGASKPIIGILSGVLGLGVGSALFGNKDTPGSDIPVTPEPTSSVIDDEITSQKQRNQQLRRQSATKTRKLTALNDNPTTEDSLIRIVAGGK